MRKYLPLILICMLMFSSCKMLFQKPEIMMIQDLKLISFSPDTSQIQLSVIIHNPNKYDIDLNKLRLELLDKNRLRVGEAELGRSLLLPGKKSTNLELKVSLLTRPLLKNLSSINNEALFFISAKGVGKAMGISKKFSFEESYSFDIQEHLEKALGSFTGNGQDVFKITRSYVDEVGLSKSKLNVDFILMNPYGLSFTFKGFPAQIFIEDKQVGQGQLRRQLKFNENVFYQEGTLVFELSNLKSIVGAGRGALRGEIAYSVKGEINLEAMGMQIKNPYEFKSKIPLSIWDLLQK